MLLFTGGSFWNLGLIEVLQGCGLPGTRQSRCDINKRCRSCSSRCGDVPARELTHRMQSCALFTL